MQHLMLGLGVFVGNCIWHRQLVWCYTLFNRIYRGLSGRPVHHWFSRSYGYVRVVGAKGKLDGTY